MIYENTNTHTLLQRVIEKWMLFPTAATRHRRWGDNDNHWGPFTWATQETYRPYAIMLKSGNDEYPGCCLQLQAFGTTLIMELPSIIQPRKQKVYFSHNMSASQNWYYDTHEREYGFYIVDGRLQINYGVQTNDSRLDQNWSWFLPWLQWRHVRQSWYGPTGQHVETLYTTDSREVRAAQREWLLEFEKTLVKTQFDFLDFDGEQITASTNIEEREWRLGEGAFKWLSWFCAPRIWRYLNLEFSSGIGPRKNSWKGGTIGHSIEMLPGELHEAAFRRYCSQNNLTFIQPGE